MTFIALETTGNLWLTTAVLIAVIISTQLTRELFGYSFATWRFHLRGETIRSAADVGWVRDLTVGRMMRSDVSTVNAAMPIADFVRKFPLGSKTQVVAVDGNGRYAGMITVADAHGTRGAKAVTAGDLAHHPQAFPKAQPAVVAQPVPQAPPGHVLHREEPRPPAARLLEPAAVMPDQVRVAEHAEVVNGDDERRTRRDGRAERRAMENVELRGGLPEAERVPERIASHGGDPALAARLQADELEAGTSRQLREEAAHVPRRPRARLDERRGVDPDPHAAALRTISFGSCLRIALHTNAITRQTVTSERSQRITTPPPRATPRSRPHAIRSPPRSCRRRSSPAR